MASLAPRPDPLHRVVVGRVAYVLETPPQTTQISTFQGLGFSTPQTPLSRGAYFSSSSVYASLHYNIMDNARFAGQRHL